jgi:hypothetical protein
VGMPKSGFESLRPILAAHFERLGVGTFTLEVGNGKRRRN